MPAPYARRDPLQSLARAVNRTAPGQAQGRFRGLSQTSSGVSGSTHTDPATAEIAIMHHIQGWDIADDTVDTFTLDFEPLLNSWNLMLNGVRVHRSEFSVSDRTVTITTPADLFLGADTQGPPWDLEIQYDCVPAFVEPATFPLVGTAGEQGDNPTVSFASSPAAGSSVLLAIRSKFGPLPSGMTGFGATWSVLSSEDGVALWLGVGCNGAGTTVSLTSDDCFWIGIVEVTTALTATGVQTTSSVSGHLLDLTAAGSGVAVSINRAGAGLANVPDASAWTSVGSGSGATLGERVIAAGTGDSLELHTNGINAWDYGLLALVRYA